MFHSPSWRGWLNRNQIHTLSMWRALKHALVFWHMVWPNVQVQLGHVKWFCWCPCYRFVLESVRCWHQTCFFSLNLVQYADTPCIEHWHLPTSGLNVWHMLINILAHGASGIWFRRKVSNAAKKSSSDLLNDRTLDLCWGWIFSTHTVGGWFCTSWVDRYSLSLIYKFLCIPGGAGFLPSTAWTGTNKKFCNLPFSKGQLGHVKDRASQKKNEKNIWRALRWLEARINLFWKWPDCRVVWCRWRTSDIYEVGPFPFFHFGRAGAKGEDGEVTYQGVRFHGQCHECLLPQHVQWWSMPDVHRRLKLGPPTAAARASSPTPRPWDWQQVDFDTLDVFVGTRFGRWWVWNMLYFHPKTWGRIPIWRAYFSDGLVKNHQLSIAVSGSLNRW